jgi:5-methylcytosine-specific restriction endonuclease McrA
MYHGAQLTPEQQAVLSSLRQALQDVRRQIGNVRFPEVYARNPRVRPPVPWDQQPSFRELYERQEGRCYYCGCLLYNGTMPKAERRRKTPRMGPQAWEIDHAQPRGRKGKDERANYRLACVECNRHKGVLTEEEFMAVIALRPRAALCHEFDGGARSRIEASVHLDAHGDVSRMVSADDQPVHTRQVVLLRRELAKLLRRPCRFDAMGPSANQERSVPPLRHLCTMALRQVFIVGRDDAFPGVVRPDHPGRVSRDLVIRRPVQGLIYVDCFDEKPATITIGSLNTLQTLRVPGQAP